LFNAYILRLIGLIRFSMYLIHPFIITILTPVIHSSNLLFITTTITTFFLSLFFTYGFIERPFTINTDQKTG
jgi:peptidoglycan/LPS O-acetylase OafA/YrhL